MARWFSMTRRQGVRLGPVQTQAARHPQGLLGADGGVMAGAEGLAGIVQQQSQVKHEGLFHPAKNLRVLAEGRRLGVPHLVQLLQADQGVFVRRVLVIELVLHQAGQAAELGQEFSQQADFVHHAQRRRDVAALVQDFQKRFPHMRVAQKDVVHQPQVLPEQLGQVGVQFQAPLLDVQKYPHEPAGAVPKYA